MWLIKAHKMLWMYLTAVDGKQQNVNFVYGDRVVWKMAVFQNASTCARKLITFVK